MSIITQIGTHWPGFDRIKRLVVFGASYCDVGYNPKAPHPSLENPLGVEFPGDTWAEPGEPNWVGHLITNHAPNPSILVYDYALGGDGVDGVRRQILQEFIPSLGGQPDWAPWTASDTLFITWVGINDCAFVAVEEIPPLVSKLFDLHDRLYDVGARNFMLVNLPPIQRSPAAGQSRGKSPYQLWNDSLRETAEQFAASHKPATILIYSSWDTFTRVLDNPATFGFKQEDSLKNGGAIWVDHLHPTSRMHDIIACDMAKFLAEIASHHTMHDEQSTTAVIVQHPQSIQTDIDSNQ